VKDQIFFSSFGHFASLLKLDKFCDCLNTWNFDIFSNIFVLLDLYLVMGRVESRKVWNARSPSIAEFVLLQNNHFGHYTEKLEVHVLLMLYEE
jgi:hypothetical protein